MNTKLFLIIFISAIALIPLSDFIFNLLESNGILTKLTIGAKVLSPRKIFSFTMFLVIGFSIWPLVVKLFVFLQIKIGNAELPLVKFLQSHEQAFVIVVWCCLILGLCIALPDSISDFTID
jgi:hypothetical protein